MVETVRDAKLVISIGSKVLLATLPKLKPPRRRAALGRSCWCLDIFEFALRK